MADVAEYHEHVEDGVYIGYTLETIEHGTDDVGYALGYHPEHNGQAATVVERLERDEDGESHEHVAGGLKITLRLHLTETERRAYYRTQPYEGEYHYAPRGCTACGHGHECER